MYNRRCEKDCPLKYIPVNGVCENPEKGPTNLKINIYSTHYEDSISIMQNVKLVAVMNDLGLNMTNSSKWEFYED